jgi:hypothetical protein
MENIKTFEQFVSEINENDFDFVPTNSRPIFTIDRIEEEEVKPQNINQIQATFIRDQQDKDEEIQ